MEKENKKSCCFTGHRQITTDEYSLQAKLAENILKAIQKGYTHFICGGAIGFDMLAAEQVCFFKDLLDDVTLEVAIPFKQQSKLYSAIDKDRYSFVLNRANKTTPICNSYSKFCYQLRNKYMVNNSSLVIAHFTGAAGGTKNTVEYAKKQGKEIWFV